MHVYTIGHSDRPLEDTAAMLRAQEVALLVDVRSHPGSRHAPQYNIENLAATLPTAHHIDYAHVGLLGGLRKGNRLTFPNPDYTDGWQNASFRNYAEYTFTGDYERGLVQLLGKAARVLPGHVAIMCAEAVPWRCHRSLISNTLVARGTEVTHIMGSTLVPHQLGMYGAPAEILNDRVVYPCPHRQGALF